MHIEVLSGRHACVSFDCGNEELNTFLRHYARQNSRANLSRTFLLVTGEGPDILGYFTLAAGALARERFPEAGFPTYPVPVAVLARLAVVRDHQGHGLGEKLLFAALARVGESAQGSLPVYAVVVDALTPSVVSFYTRYGFRPLAGDDPLHLYIPIRQVWNSPLANLSQIGSSHAPKRKLTS